ncbi:trypsin-like peptidase domain-containing protein [Candidatus Bathycorpusculum sp.]|uniref:S1C family serine protease n=1 Tax=Candidatus Bathycorpusculum sp. TaxID=2994959 RepID=UPI00282F4B3B|nr:trypsin-like peptidase domain-containing protein [Candidatus Termitimicrobium sp.]MCL2685020.1 trypsin-like peptidase domain-containing protein [Candidatus Termitimicrobium sp.]
MFSSKDATKTSVSMLMLLFVAGLLVGGLLMFYVNSQQVNSLNDRVDNLQASVSNLQGFQNATYQNITLLQNETSLADLYANVRDSVVLIQGQTDSKGVQGSGFIYDFAGQIVIITNYHVVAGTTNLSVTLSNGKGYSATILGSDPYVDLSILSIEGASAENLKPVTIVSSSPLRVGEPVIAIGNPYGLVGSLTTGVVSATGRSIVEDSAGGFSIANVIQTSTPINPGNSGGLLLNSLGNVVGITTAIVTDSQGLGFAIPSNTILREIADLIQTGSYHGHSYLGVTGGDMNYAIATQTGVSVTYGWKIVSIVRDGPCDGKLKVNDIIIGMNDQIIKNNDDLASYLEENTLPGQTIDLLVVRGTETLKIPLTLGTRPPPSS